MRRREFITLLGGAAASRPLAAAAQQTRVRRIGIVSVTDERDLETQSRVAAFQQELQKLGWTEGRNLRIDYRWTGGAVDRTRAIAKELIDLAPDVILVQSNVGVAAFQQATRTIPIVFVSASVPVESGFVASLAHPGGNITGFTNFEAPMGGKWLEALKEIASGVSRVAVILQTDVAANVRFLRAAESAAPTFGVALTAVGVYDATEIERAITAFAAGSNGGLIVLPNPVNITHRELILRLAARHRLPAVYPYRYFATEGGLMSYGVDQAEMYRRAAPYVDRILRGVKPGELPVQASEKFELVINLKTAKALGLTVSPALLVRANEVIE